MSQDDAKRRSLAHLGACASRPLRPHCVAAHGARTPALEREVALTPRGTRADHYQAIATFYGLTLVEHLRNPNVPEFAIQSAARRAAHFALAAARLQEKGKRRRCVLSSAAAQPVAPPTVSESSRV